MSSSENISLWKKKAEIDYISIFMSLWLSLNAWMRDRIKGKTDREIINYLKSNGLDLKDEFAELMQQENAKSHKFKGNFAELYRALNNANILYTKGKVRGGKVSFENCVIDWNSGNQKLESIKAESWEAKEDHEGAENPEPLSIKIDNGLWIDSNNDRVFAAYIEILYQVRCALFHGGLSPRPENERVIKQLYLTLSMIMENV